MSHLTKSKHPLFEVESRYSQLRGEFFPAEKWQGFFADVRWQNGQDARNRNPPALSNAPITEGKAVFERQLTLSAASGNVLECVLAVTTDDSHVEVLDREVTVRILKKAGEDQQEGAKLVVQVRRLPAGTIHCRLFPVVPGMQQFLKDSDPELAVADHQEFCRRLFDPRRLATNREVIRILSGMTDLDAVANESGFVSFEVSLPLDIANLPNETLLMIVGNCENPGPTISAVDDDNMSGVQHDLPKADKAERLSDPSVAPKLIGSGMWGHRLARRVWNMSTIIASVAGGLLIGLLLRVPSDAPQGIEPLTLSSMQRAARGASESNHREFTIISKRPGFLSVINIIGDEESTPFVIDPGLAAEPIEVRGNSPITYTYQGRNAPQMSIFIVTETQADGTLRRALRTAQIPRRDRRELEAYVVAKLKANGYQWIAMETSQNNQ
ncbi:MAG: hypothetical protein ACK6D3_15520 [Planctomycetaceae bacterium]|jgi:hypothetical protein